MGDYFHLPLEEISHKVDNFNFGTGQGGDPIHDSITSVSSGAGSWADYMAERGARKPFPGSYQRFMEQWTRFANNGNKVDPATEPAFEEAKQAIIDAFREVVQADSDWAFTGLSDEEIDQAALGAFDAFLKNFPYDKYPPPPTPPGSDPADPHFDDTAGGITSEDFFGEWRTFMTVTAVVMNVTQAGPYASMPAFEEIYQGFFPPGADPTAAALAFQARLEDFAKNHVDGQGFFLPSQQVDDWTRELREVYSRTNVVKLSRDEKLRRNVMLLVFKLLRTILERLQETAAMQADRLRFLTEYQGEYTELMGRVPIYQAGAPRLVGSASRWQGHLGSELTSQAKDQIKSGLGSSNEGDLYDAKGFAGITLREIREAGLIMPTVFGFAEWMVLERAAQEGNLDPDDQDYVDPNPDSYEGDASGQDIRNLIASGQPIPTGERFPIPDDTIFAHLAGQDIPGVWWLVEQPYDGSAKYKGEDLDEEDAIKEESALRQDINQVRQQWIEQLRSHRNIVKDEAKQAQSAMSNTRESINQQSNLMTSIIQQLSTILQAIFR